jgi:shikimate kinase
MKNLALLGFMGSGKSTVGRLVAAELKFQFIDLDRMIEEQEGISISEIFEQRGEASFRDLESKLLQEISKKKDLVLATGGGVVLCQANVDLLNKTSVLIYLHVDVETAVARTKGHSHRPLLMEGDFRSRVEKLLQERQSLYDKIPHSVETVARSPLEVAHAVIRIYRAHQN